MTLEDADKRRVYDQLGWEKYEDREKMTGMMPEFKWPKTFCEWVCFCFQMCCCLWILCCFCCFYTCLKCCGCSKRFDAYMKKKMDVPDFDPEWEQKARDEPGMTQEP